MSNFPILSLISHSDNSSKSSAVAESFDNWLVNYIGIFCTHQWFIQKLLRYNSFIIVIRQLIRNFVFLMQMGKRYIATS